MPFNPDMYELKYIKAVHLLDGGSQKDVEQAITLLASIVEQRPYDIEMLLHVAHILFDHEKWDAATPAVNLISAYGNELDNSINYAVFRARTYSLQGKDAIALNILREVVTLVPYHSRAWSLIFQYSLSQSDYKCGQDALLRLLHIDPWNAPCVRIVVAPI